MDVTSTGAAGAAAVPKKTETVESATSALTGDFDTFLQLLTTQMKNQDPLQPMNSTEFIAQLASFSGVEQQIGSNTRLDAILAALSGTGTESLAGWIGRRVEAPASAQFTGAPVDVAVTPVAAADRAILVVRNDFDSEIARLEVPAAAASLSWTGTDSLGNPVAEGSYAFTLESYAGETLLGTQAGRVFSTVSEVRLGADGGATLLLEGGAEVAPEAVTALR